MSTQPFTPQGNTITFTANTAAPTAIQANATGALGCSNYLLQNAGNVTVFVGVGNSAVNANTAAVIPGANSAPSVPILGGAIMTLSFAPNSFFTGITSANTAVVYITPGDGS